MSLHWGRSLRLVLPALFKVLVFRLFRAVFVTVQKVCWRVTGVQQRLTKASTPQGYELSAHVLNVLTWCKFDEPPPTSFRDLLLTHKEFVHPETVLIKDNVFLWFIDDDKAIFAVGDEGKLLWKSKYYPFNDMSLLHNCNQVIVLPMASFERLADEMEEPKAPIIFCGNTGRCGSTLLTQLLEFTDRIVTFSEPNILSQIAQRQDQKGNNEEVKLFTRRIFKVMCKPLGTFPDPVAIFFKTIVPCTMCMTIVKVVYPDSILLYLYRNMDGVSASMYKLSFVLPFIRLLFITTRFSGWMTRYMLHCLGFPSKDANFTTRNNLSSGAFLALIANKTYVELREKGVEVHGIKFEHLIKDTELATRAIFKVCGINQSLVELALRATMKDSQGNSVIAKTVLDAFKVLRYTQEDKVQASALLVRYGFPSLEEDAFLEGTLDFGMAD